MKKLGVVIIGRNSEKTLSGVFSSLILEINKLDFQCSILYVDSASTDQSVNIAIKHGVNVVKIQEGEWRCAAAGRYLGTSLIDSEYILYLDSDMEIEHGWLNNAINFLDDNKKVALVTGERVDQSLEDGNIINIKQRVNEAKKTEHFSGSCVARTSYVTRVGGFDPYLISNEEKDLCDRLIDNNYDMYVLPYKMVSHYGPSPDFNERIRRGQMGYYKGIGQYVKRLLHRKQYFKAFRKIRTQVIFILMTFLSIPTVYIFNTTTVLSILLLLYLVTIYRFNGVKRAWLFIVSQPMLIKGIFEGFIDDKMNKADKIYNPKIERF